MEWRKVDLHLHTPASKLCYAEQKASYLQILQRAEDRDLDIIAFTDHNTVAGYAGMRSRVAALEMLEQLGRLLPEEKQELAEYRRLLGKILVLPGFEFTATLGFHVLGIFPEQTSVRELEHILLTLRIPPDKLDFGSSEVGATVDALTAYRVMAEAGGLVIAAHANSTHGVAMLGYDFGGQTKISYTQDPNLHALEVTDLDSNRRRNTASFFSGVKPEYPRRMHCIQGSDAHALTRDQKDKNILGVGERITEVLLPEVSFAALKEVFLQDDFARTRPYRPQATKPFDHIQAAREQGANIVQSFHEAASRQRGRLKAILRDVVAFANTNGGTIYVGASANLKTPIAGVQRADEVINLLRVEIIRAIAPLLEATLDVQKSDGKDIVRIVVPKGANTPYVLEGVEVYVREESQTSLAVRDEIVTLVKQALISKAQAVVSEIIAPEKEPEKAEEPQSIVAPPRTGVEILETIERKGVAYYTLKDLRNGNVVRDVTRSSARKLWAYAISQRETKEHAEAITWQDDLGLVREHKWAGRVRYDLAQRDAQGNVHVYYGVTEDGIHGEWRRFIKPGQQ
jgi:hypothetical protein